MKKVLFPAAVALFSAIILSSAASGEFKIWSPFIKGKPMTGFDSGLKSSGSIESRYAASDKGPSNKRSFPFYWKNLPEGTKYLAIILDDPDAKKVLESHGIKADSFLHWIAADIDPSKKGLKDNASALSHNFVQGKNGAGNIGYTGPQPPSDFPKDAKRPIVHIYRLKVLALSASTGLKDGFSLDDLLGAVKDKTLGTAELDFSYHN
ncbi:MAG: YbhB/YbcL family Raf kinase inhibitor-like protein [Brevinematales bacterium]|jgi:Raf kinase inhibitor-like YbhB/YbcL family protein